MEWKFVNKFDTTRVTIVADTEDEAWEQLKANDFDPTSFILSTTVTGGCARGVGFPGRNDIANQNK